jgi:hypothetical protein
MLKLLDKLMIRLNRKKLIYDRVDGELYLTRYYLFLKERSKFPFNIFLHKFHKSDDVVLHDHPWSYITVIIKGGYWEWTPIFDKKGKKITEKCTWRGPGNVKLAPANSYHRVEIDPEIAAWTLFIPGAKQREWGFLVKNTWVQWEQYLKQRKTS